MVEIATPLSTLFKNEENGLQIMKLSDCLECRDRTWDSNVGNQKLFHSDLQPIHKWGDKEFNYFSLIAKNKPNLELVSFHMASSCDQPKYKGRMYISGGSNYTKSQMLENLKFNLGVMRNIFGENMNFALENNNYYPTDAYNVVTEADFITEAILSNNAYFLFDISHAKVTCHNKGINFHQYVEGLPLEHAIQVHLSKEGVDEKDGLAYDFHNAIGREDLLEVKEYLLKFANIKYVTIEFYKETSLLLEMLTNLRRELSDIRQITQDRSNL